MTDRALHKTALVTLIASTLVFLILLAPDALMIMMSPMAFDSGVTAPTVVFVVNLIGFPLMLLVSIPSSWVAYRRKFDRLAIALGLLPLVNVAIFGAMFAL